MKRLARILRRWADHLDPPRSTSRMCIRVECDTSAARESLARLGERIQEMDAAVAHIRKGVVA